jgi:flagellar biosynthesis protein FliR
LKGSEALPWLLSEILLALPVFALVLFRVSGLMLTAPVFASALIPIRVRAAFAFVLAAMIFPLVASSAPTQLTLGAVIGGGVMELVVGAVIGLTLTIFLMGAELAGHSVGQQAGLIMGEIVDPTQNTRTSIVGQVYTISLMVLFLLVGGLRATVAALIDTYSAVPMLSFSPGDSLLLLMIETLTASFMLGLRVAGPVLIAIFLVGLALAFLSRTMPQMNILTVGFSIRTIVALGTAGLALSVGQELFHTAIWDALLSIRWAFGMDTSLRYVVD